MNTYRAPAKPKKMVKYLEAGDRYLPNGLGFPMQTVSHVVREGKYVTIHHEDGTSRNLMHHSKRVTLQ